MGLFHVNQGGIRYILLPFPLSPLLRSFDTRHVIHSRGRMGGASVFTGLVGIMSSE